MTPATTRSSAHGMTFGLLGVLSFSLTLPATRLAVASLDPLLVGLGRGVAAACLAAPLLWFTHQRRPTRTELHSLVIVALGVIVGFPVLSAWAMCQADASHGAVVLGLLPLATALAGVVRTHERPSPAFWLSSVAGSLTVVAFALSSGGGRLCLADVALIGAVLAAAMGYAEGARLARTLGGWQVISWAAVLATPFLLPPVAWLAWRHGLAATAASWAGFSYVSVVSSFLGFFAWYRGLAAGGVARVSQLQLLQPFLTMAFAALFLHEPFGWGGLACALLVAGSVYLSRKSRITPAPVAALAGGGPVAS